MKSNIKNILKPKELKTPEEIAKWREYQDGKWYDDVYYYLNANHDIPEHDEILETFMNIVGDELAKLLEKGVGADKAADIVAGNENAWKELNELYDEEFED